MTTDYEDKQLDSYICPLCGETHKFEGTQTLLSHKYTEKLFCEARRKSANKGGYFFQFAFDRDGYAYFRVRNFNCRGMAEGFTFRVPISSFETDKHNLHMISVNHIIISGNLVGSKLPSCSKCEFRDSCNAVRIAESSGEHRNISIRYGFIFK